MKISSKTTLKSLIAKLHKEMYAASAHADFAANIYSELGGSHGPDYGPTNEGGEDQAEPVVSNLLIEMENSIIALSRHNERLRAHLAGISLNTVGYDLSASIDDAEEDNSLTETSKSKKPYIPNLPKRPINPKGKKKVTSLYDDDDEEDID